MAGHSKFKNIMHRKGAQDKKRAKTFNKIAREITVAAKMGAPDPDANPRLKNAIIAARANNMPNDRIKRAISQGTGDGDDGANYEEIRYEGYGPGGVAVIVEALTDNRNRTASEVRSTFSKKGGALGETNSVSFLFARVGMITYPVDIAEFDTMFESAAEAGAENVEQNDDVYEIYTAPDDLGAVRDALEAKYGETKSSELVWKPENTIPVSGDKAASLLSLIELLEDSDDVQNVSTNMEIDDAEMERLLAS